MRSFNKSTVKPCHVAGMDKEAAILPDKAFLSLFGDDSGDEGAVDAEQQTVSENVEEDDFDELIKGKYKDKFREKCQRVIDRRFRETKELEAYRDKASRIIEALGEKYGKSPDDLDDLFETLKGDSSNTERETRARDRALKIINDARRDEGAKRIYDSFISEAESLKAKYPDFDLDEEVKNPVFAAMLGAGMSVTDAHEAINKDRIVGEVMEYTAKAVSEALARNYAKKTNRPLEGALSPVGSRLAKRSVASMSDDEIMEVVRKVQRGEKVVF